MMASLKQYLLVSAAAAALASALAAPAHAQYHYYKPAKPNVEVDLGALSGDALAPTAQQPAEGNMPPVVLRQPLAPPPVPAAAPEPQPAVQPAPAAAETAAPQDNQPRRVIKPMFSEPVVPPLPKAAATPVTQPPVAASEMPRRTVTAETPATAPRAKLMAPILEPTPAQHAARAETIAHPMRKPDMAPAPAAQETALLTPQETREVIPAPQAALGTQKSPAAPAARISYPPAARPAADIQRFERPVLPEGLRGDEYAAPAVPAMPAKPATIAAATPEAAAPAAVAAPAPQEAIATLPLRKPPMEELPQTVLSDDDIAALSVPPVKDDMSAAIENKTNTEDMTLAEAAALYGETLPDAPAPQAEKPAAPRPSLVVVESAPAAEELPRRQPVTTTLPATTALDAAAETPAAPIAAEASANRDSLVPLSSDEAEALLASRPAPKPTEKIRPPLSAPELEKISQNIEAVPARVALAPPAPQPRDIAVPTLADLTLEFDGTSSDLTADTQQKLVNIIPHLRESKARRLAVHAYASGEDGSKTSARRISLSRALAVRSFLMDNGVEPTRVDVRALGLETDRKPLERVDLVFAR
ncbi:MAG TPA: OmpA family protein [Alphaproteobacteria bacterium]|nr:OmpA family protein [Alphaproteobacteria bacterium]